MDAETVVDQFEGKKLSSPNDLVLRSDDFDRPNGIVLSPDESTLYVADTAKEHVRSFAVQAGGEVTGGAVFVDLQSDLQGNPDGMAVDVFGNIYVTGGGGVRVVTPAGAVLGTIMVPGGGDELHLRRPRRDGAVPDGPAERLSPAPHGEGRRPALSA